MYDQFSSNISMSNGRYEVSLPWKDSFPSIPDNLLLSQGRLRSVLKRLKQNTDIQREYDRIIHQQLESGIIETVEDVDQQTLEESTIFRITRSYGEIRRPQRSALYTMSQLRIEVHH